MFSRVHAEREVGISTPGSGNLRRRRAKAKKRAKNFLEKAKRFPGSTWRMAWKVGKEDPRRVIHALKVGVSLTLVSLLYLMEPLFQGIGKNAIWAVMTVVLVFEFTAGATLCKGLNRGLGTLVAGSLGYSVQYIINHANRIFHAIFIAVSVFLIGAAATYIRFFPYIKKNYEYGVIIFLLTFNLITVSSYRVQNVLNIANERLYTIALGCAICLLMSLLIFPHWSGEDLHNSTVSKLEGLAESIQACVDEYFDENESEETDDESSTEDADEDTICKGYKAVLDSKSSDETMALHASWEPRHSFHCYKCPWQQYVKIGVVLRNFGYTVVALHGCLRSEIQSPRPVRALFKNPCTRLSGEVSKVLMELADSIRNRSRFLPEILSDDLHEALQDLNTTLKSPLAHDIKPPRPTQEDEQQEKQPHDHNTPAPSERKIVLKTRSSRIAVTSLDFSEALPLAAFASLLLEAVAKLDHVIEEVEVLGKMARYCKEGQSGPGSSSGHDENHANKDDKVRVTSETPRVALPE